MGTHRPATQTEMRWIGALAAAVGLYFTLVGFGVLPIPGGPRSLHGPLWIVLLAGLVFFLAGLALLLQAIGRANESGELPPEAPRWLRVAQYMIGLMIFASFALVGSWIAFGPGPRHFSGDSLFFGEATNAIIGRAMFGIGAIITWFCTIVLAVSGARKLLRAGKPDG